MTKTTLAQRITLILKEQGLKKVEFASALGISANYVSLLSGGKKTGISEPLAKLIESTYGYSAEWILNGTGNYRKVMVTDLREDMIQRIKQMKRNEILAVSAFIRTLEELGE